MEHLKEGDHAPEFRLQTGPAESVALNELKGKKFVLYFYPRDDTSGCTAEAIAFNALRSQFEDAGARVLGISPDSPASHARFKRKHQLDLTLASDETTAMLQAYGVWKEKSMYGRRYLGVERTTMLVDAEGVIARIWRKVKVAGHAAEVLQAAQAL